MAANLMSKYERSRYVMYENVKIFFAQDENDCRPVLCIISNTFH